MFSLDDRAVSYPASSSREWRDSCLSIDTRTTLHVILVIIYLMYTLYNPEIRASRSNVHVDTLHSASRMSRFSDVPFYDLDYRLSSPSGSQRTSQSDEKLQQMTIADDDSSVKNK